MPSGNDLLNNPLVFYALPSLFALATKLLIFWLARHSLKEVSPWLWGLMISLFGLNLVEPVGFVYYVSPDDVLNVLLLFYCFAIASVASMLGLAMEISQLMNKTVRNMIVIMAALCMVIILVPGVAIEGIKSIGYSVTRVAGPYYWVIQLYIVVSLILAIALLFYSARLKANTLQARKALIMLIAYGPVVLVVFVVMLLMQLGVPINATIFLSLSVNFSLAVLLYTEKQHCLFLFLSVIPHTQENQAVKKVGQLLMDPSQCGLDGARAIFEQELAFQAMRQAKGNKSEAARLLKVSRQTLLRKLEKKKS